MRRANPLNVERLEDRTTPAVFGNPWPDATHLTLSFAPDGTSLGGQPSTLLQTLDATASRDAWQRDVLRAFQTWAVNGNINVGLVPDQGQPFGGTGPTQGDTRFGDLRIGAVPLAEDVLAVALPFDVSAGPWSGDVRLNSNSRFGSGAAYDLFTVMLHEAGHALGVAPSANAASVMYQVFTGARSGLNRTDVTALQALYGARQPDAFDAKKSNDTLAKASRLVIPDDPGELLGGTAFGDITTLRDLDHYRFKFENTTAPVDVTIRLVTSGLSGLLARLTIYDSAGRVVGTTAATDPLRGDLSLRVPRVAPLAEYTIKVQSASGDVFGIGSYRLEVVPDGGSLPQPRFHDDDAGTNDTAAFATDLRKKPFRADARYDSYVEASLSTATDVDYYRVRAPQSGGTMTALVWRQDSSGLDPRIAVFNSVGQPVAAEVLVNDNGSYTIQVPNLLANRDYYLTVRAANSASGAVGNYAFGVDFRTAPARQTSFSSGILTATSPEAQRTLTVTQSSLFHFVASATTATTPLDPNVALRMTVYDANKAVVFSQFVGNGDIVTGNIFLAPGTYTFRFAAATRDGRPLPAFRFTLKGDVLSDPIGPRPADTSGSLFGAPPTVGPPSLPPFSWQQFGSVKFDGPADPYGTPWWF